VAGTDHHDLRALRQLSSGQTGLAQCDPPGPAAWQNTTTVCNHQPDEQASNSHCSGRSPNEFGDDA
jgi:hypothetical protein